MPCSRPGPANLASPGGVQRVAARILITRVLLVSDEGSRIKCRGDDVFRQVDPTRDRAAHIWPSRKAPFNATERREHDAVMIVTQHKGTHLCNN